MYLITNGLIVTEKEVLEGFDLYIKDDRIDRLTIRGKYKPRSKNKGH